MWWFVLVFASVTSLCGAGFCQTNSSPSCVTGSEPECACVVSQRGTPCVECSSFGYVAGDRCVCNLFDMDPAFQCEVPLPTNQTVTVERIFANATCAYFFSDDLGFFKNATYSGTYGQVDYISTPECWNAAIGPDPALIPLETPETTDLQACRRFGGPDPNTTSVVWRECSNHGQWNTATQRCDCDVGWDLVETDFENPQSSAVNTNRGTNQIVTCGNCVPFYGPRPGTVDEPICLGVFTPDPIDNVEKTCGGHGAWAGSGCACFNSTTTGFWRLAPVTKEFTVLEYTGSVKAFAQYVSDNVTVDSCVECSVGTIASGCL